MNSFSEIAEVEKLLEAQRQKKIKKRQRRLAVKDHPYKYFICIDFEATCWDAPVCNKRKIQEIIEFPAVLINIETGKIEKEFQRYCKPTEIPTLSEYCINLTGITQDKVDNGSLLADVMEEFRLWVKETIKEKELILPKTKSSNLAGNTALMTW